MDISLLEVREEVRGLEVACALPTTLQPSPGVEGTGWKR